MNRVNFEPNLVATIYDVNALNKLSPEDIRDNIRSINAQQIHLIGKEISKNIFNSIGPIGKARIDQIVMEKKGEVPAIGSITPLQRQLLTYVSMSLKKGNKQSSPEEHGKNVPENGSMTPLERRIIADLVTSYKKENKQFNPEEHGERFLSIVLSPVEDAIKDSFSRPEWFLDNGIEFQISDNKPVGVLKKTAEEIDIIMGVNDVPTNYYIHLQLDKELAQKGSELVFALIQKSEGVEFSNKTFTIKELEMRVSRL